jgi:hypothetical protein
LSGAIGWLELGNHFEANDCRKIVLRLIEAGELPKTAQKQFDLTFPSNTIENHQ